MEYNHDDIEFAVQILENRNKLEQTAVENWMQIPEHMELIKYIARIKRCRNPYKISITKKNEELIRLKKAIRLRKIRKIRYGSAAAVILIITAGLLSEIIQKPLIEKIEPIAAEMNKVPGQAEVELFLASGAKVILGKNNIHVEGSVEKGIRNDSSQRLSYASASIKETGAEEEVYNTLKVPVSGFYRLELADGTRVWLNSVTELRYPVEFSGKERKVYLSGEAYFEVTRNPSRPFIVETSGIRVKVYGTDFNINTHDPEIIRTTLVNGEIGVKIINTGEESVLHPNQTAEYSCSMQKLNIKKDIDTYIHTAWKDGKFIFEKESIEKIMERLYRWYGISAVYENEDVKKQIFSGVMTRFARVEDVLHLIAGTATVDFEIKGNTVFVK